MDDVRIHTGTLIADLLLPHARSIKDTRQALRSLRQRLVNRHLSVAQVGPSELRQRVFLAIATVTRSASTLDGALDEAERVIYASDFEVAELRRDVKQVGFSSQY